MLETYIFSLTFFRLCFFHALADYPLQGDFLVRAKRGLIEGCPAFMGLLFHSLIHAGFVLYATQSVELGMAELVFHFLIDRAKCAGHFGMKVDQALHILCKVAWAVAFMLWRPL